MVAPYVKTATPVPAVARVKDTPNLIAPVKPAPSGFARYKASLPNLPSVTELFHKPRQPGR